MPHIANQEEPDREYGIISTKQLEARLLHRTWRRKSTRREKEQELDPKHRDVSAPTNHAPDLADTSHAVGETETGRNIECRSCMQAQNRLV
ncbi:hypothetical protein HBH64_012320 [Parastagonospora nodorum]|nr:hypothetical protein HBH51_125370 [Parastagonospora nodorum]KAH4025517.1 hypothetical protein HBI09_154500 [Parastagonospora nodorum]KAH4075169.1 hypothetical protein HBH50_034790 [Parastagonospora nodorum]KAH4097228.1 hypothetical protein HBH48_043660 [Parastagonospora nodorum]KAH4312704.1 hypothetical protein HBI01_009860 [Parastagonospora nodorum]